MREQLREVPSGRGEGAYAMALEPVGLDRLETLAEGLDHSEGIAIGPDGSVYVGNEAGEILRLEDGELRVVARPGGFILGLAFDADGLLYACDDERKLVLRIDPQSGEWEQFFAGTEERPLRSPNWPAFDAQGNLYVSDSGGWQQADGAIWVIRPGRRAEIFTEESADFPNGLALAPDGSKLYAVESTPGRIIEIPIDDDGSAGPRRVLCELGYVVPDGIALVDDGSVVIACYRPDAIYRWSEADGLEVLAADPQGTALSAPTNIAFGGPDRSLAIFPNLAGWHLSQGRFGLRGVPLALPSTELVDGGGA